MTRSTPSVVPSVYVRCRGRSCARSRILTRVDFAVSGHPDPNSASGLNALPDTQSAREPRSHVPSRGSFADFDHPSYYDPNLAPHVSAATPSASSLPHPTIPNTTLSHPVTYGQFLRGDMSASTTPLHPSNALSSLHTLHPRTRYTLPIVSQDLSPNAPYFRLSPQSSRTRLTDFTTNEPYSFPTRIPNFIVSSENSSDSSRRSSCSTVRTRSRSFVILRSYDMASMPSESPRPPQSVAFTYSSRERPGRSTNHSRPEELFPQRGVANSRGPRSYMRSSIDT